MGDFEDQRIASFINKVIARKLSASNRSSIAAILPILHTGLYNYPAKKLGTRSVGNFLEDLGFEESLSFHGNVEPVLTDQEVIIRRLREHQRRFETCERLKRDGVLNFAARKRTMDEVFVDHKKLLKEKHWRLLGNMLEELKKEKEI